MKKQAITLALLLCFCLGFAQQKTETQLSAEFDKMLSAQFKETGATALVAKNGQVIYTKAFGMANLEYNLPMQTDNVFRIGSITKQFTAVAILQLMEQGKLKLQDDITKFIPDYPTQGNKITIEHLLTHTSGIEDYTAIKDYPKRMMLDMTPSELIASFKNEPMRFAPGTKYSYSNSNYVLLGRIIELLSGKPYSDYIEKQIFAPVGMSKTLYASDTKLVGARAAAYSRGETGYENAPALSMTQPYAAGSVLSTVSDLFKWHQALLSNKLIKKENLNSAFTNYKLADGTNTNYGYGWKLGNIYDSPSIWHGGAINGFSTMELYLPKEDVYVAVFSNCDCNSPKEVASKMAAVASGKIAEHKEIALSEAALPEYQGVYENAKGLQRIITVAHGKLYVQSGRGPKAELKSYHRDRFFLNPMQTIEITRNKKGKIEKLITKNLNGNETWMKTPKAIPSENGIKVNEAILKTYVGDYQVSPQFVFSISNEQDRLFLIAPGQEKLEMYAETDSKFFLKVNDAQFEFVKESGMITKALMQQGGRQAEAKKIK